MSGSGFCSAPVRTSRLYAPPVSVGPHAPPRPTPCARTAGPPGGGQRRPPGRSSGARPPCHLGPPPTQPTSQSGPRVLAPATNPTAHRAHRPPSRPGPDRRVAWYCAGRPCQSVLRQQPPCAGLLDVDDAIRMREMALLARAPGRYASYMPRPEGTPPQNLRFCRSEDGTRLAYAVHGSGPPLLLASCWLSHLEFDWQSPVWRHFLLDLGRFATVIRYDERGFGMSDWDVQDFGLDARVADLAAVVDAAGQDRFALVTCPRVGRWPYLRDTASAPALPVGPLRDVRRRSATRAGRQRDGRSVPTNDQGGVGPAGQRLPQGVHQPHDPERHRGAGLLAGRAPGEGDVNGQRDAVPCGPNAGRRVDASA